MILGGFYKASNLVKCRISSWRISMRKMSADSSSLSLREQQNGIRCWNSRDLWPQTSHESVQINAHFITVTLALFDTSVIISFVLKSSLPKAKAHAIVYRENGALHKQNKMFIRLVVVVNMHFSSYISSVICVANTSTSVCDHSLVCPVNKWFRIIHKSVSIVILFIWLLLLLLTGY